MPQDKGRKPLIPGHREALRGAWLEEALLKVPTPKVNFLLHSPTFDRVGDVWD